MLHRNCCSEARLSACCKGPGITVGRALRDNGKAWHTARVTTNGELDAAMDRASQGDTGCYIEIVAGKHDNPPAAKVLHKRWAELYGITRTPWRQGALDVKAN